MKNRQLKEQSLLVLLSQNNFIIPEIQREYVWGNNKEVLERFLDSIISKAGENCDSCGNFYSQSKINVGFLYTYKPSYVNYSHERFLDENLIDGQQRFTTLFLLLFYMAIKEHRIEDFLEAIRFDEFTEIAFDYKVRNLTHIFILDLVSKVSSIDQFRNLLSGKTTWFLNDFDKDVTVKSMISALRVIELKFSDKKQKYFSYLLNNIKFYHFRTEATNQGEELYITMNARGEALSKNEENKAILMFDDSSLFQYGSKWEEWQDYFWKNRMKSDTKVNADIGLNEFLRWIQIIEMTLSDRSLDTDEDEKIDEQSQTKKIITLIQGGEIQLNKQYFSIESMERYFNALLYIFETFFNDTQYFKEYDGINSNLISKDWLCPKEKRISQIDSFKFLPLLHYVNRHITESKELDSKKIFRLIKYLNNLTRDITVTKTIGKQVINAIKLVDALLYLDSDIAKIVEIEKQGVSKTLLTPEEKFKFNIYLKAADRELVESSFWKAEDNKILNGKISPIIQISYYSDLLPDFEYSKNFEGFKADHFSLEVFVNHYRNFSKICQESENSLSDNIWAAMFLTDYYTVGDYNESLKTITCYSSQDFDLLRSRFFLKTVFEMQNFDNAKDYFQNIFHSFITRYSSLEDLQDEVDEKSQLYAYYVALKNSGDAGMWHFSKGRNFGIYPDRPDCFFKSAVRFQHYKQKWFGAESNYFHGGKNEMIKFYDKIYN